MVDFSLRLGDVVMPGKVVVVSVELGLMGEVVDCPTRPEVVERTGESVVPLEPELLGKVVVSSPRSVVVRVAGNTVWVETRLPRKAVDSSVGPKVVVSSVNSVV